MKPVPAKAVAKTTRKKTAEPAASAAKAKKVVTKPPAAKAGKAVKAAKVTKPAPPGKTTKATKATKVAKPAKAAKPAAKTTKAVKPAPARAATKAKSPTVARSTRPRKSEGTQVAEAPKGRRGGTATKTPPKAAPAAVVDKVETANFPPKTLEKLRRLLEEERETYVRQARDLAAEAEALASEREPGDTQFDEESGEGDTLNVERERDLALSASATQAVEEIDRALRRMDAGSYGICERCGKKIAVARLEALPFAALCIECKSREERRR
ncbi:MAG TPA: TraR/DksA C4-type zinc finger protein [Acidimicrobiia bacterium]|nr:TraR/DksA C4-type zinc finger protein [Acidimicrobiia bacterium]